MIIQQDEIDSYIPKNARLVFLGTMCALNARTINGEKPKGDFFYYNDNRNHFWKILQYIFQPDTQPHRLSIREKKQFLKKHKIGILNLVSEIQTPNDKKLDPSDSVLFECHRKHKILFKSVRPEELKIIKDVDLFFTCRYKKGIHLLLEGFLKTNDLGLELIDKTHYLKTPTRCNPYERSIEWIDEMGL